MPVTMPIHEVKNHLSQVIADLAVTGDEVHITKHGRVVARLVPSAPRGMRLGLGARPGATAPDLDDLRWGDDELDHMLGGQALPE